MKPKFYAFRYKTNQNDQLTSSTTLSSPTAIGAHFSNNNSNYYFNNNLFLNPTMINYNNRLIAQLTSDSNCNFLKL